MNYALTSEPTKIRLDRQTGQQCYDCMSKFYGDNWDRFNLENKFNRPADFTDKCNNPMDKKVVRYRSCDTVCVQMSGYVHLWGKRWVKGVKGVKGLKG